MGGGQYRSLPPDPAELYASVVLPGVGHWMQQEDADGVNAALLGFLASLD